MISMAARFILRLWGWRLDQPPPATGRYIVAIAPHTSNWDFVILFLFKLKHRIPASWIGKQSLFETPVLGRFMRWGGGVPVDRSAPRKVVDQLAQRFRQKDNLILGIAPEGRRRKMPYWKSGFYYAALSANVPVRLCALDYGDKRVRFSEPIEISGNVGVDMDGVRDFFRHVTGRRPANMGPVVMKSELTPDAGDPGAQDQHNPA